MLAHDVDKYKDTIHIILVVLEWLGNALSYGLEASEVDDSIDLIISEYLVECHTVTDVSLNERDWLADNLLYPTQGLWLRVDEIVHNNDLMAGFIKLDDSMCTYESGTAWK